MSKHHETAACCIWFTGLSGSGKTTLSRLVHQEFQAHRIPAERLDGDSMRASLCKDLGFSREDRESHLRRLGLVSHLLTRNGIVCLVAAIAPYASLRERTRELIGNYIEVYCNCSWDALVSRDPKGLYRKALAGSVPLFTGLSAPYEPPEAPDIEVRTDHENVERSLAHILACLHDRGVIPLPSQSLPAPVEAPGEEQRFKRLVELGFAADTAR